MLQLSEKQAQDIVDKMMQDIPYNINIMNEQGIIIGSGQKERVGTIHQGAVRALTTGDRVEVWQDGRLEKMGTNEPIRINHQYVGVIGISGHPDEVRPFCNIVRTTVSLLIEQRNQLESLAHEASRKKPFWNGCLPTRVPIRRRSGGKRRNTISICSCQRFFYTFAFPMKPLILARRQAGYSYSFPRSQWRRMATCSLF